MNREILFRGKRGDNGEWVEGSLLQSEATVGGRTNCEIVGRFAFANDIGRYKVDPSTIGQYTSLKDRNGRKIFEGDIIDSWAGIPDDNEMYIRRVVFDDNYGILTLNPGTGYTLCRDNAEKLFEVIGTIHDTHLTKQP